ncbi:MAG: hypothetical protein QOJ09_1822 [Actinomycetota bacterium]|nr:hypothetical protein [Actinomycetota bacterium]
MDDPLVRASWAGTAVFTVVSSVAVGVDGARTAAVAVDLALFVAGTVVFLVALARAVARSREELITLPGVFFLQGSAPPAARRHLLTSVAVEVVVAFTTAGLRPYTNLAFGILVPIYGLALVGLWGATRGRYEARG